ncbi:hypothetical protein C8J57DRAFT_1516023 [Mycena rebaudengoi]|nr:hypothetical protein C8J57DRAFT_1516023 [Mycena rebaudengoi]
MAKPQVKIAQLPRIERLYLEYGDAASGYGVDGAEDDASQGSQHASEGFLYHTSPDARLDYSVNQQEGLAIEELTGWATTITDFVPSTMPFPNGRGFNPAWLDKALLHFPDPQAHLQVKTYTNCIEGVMYVEDILELAMRFRILFQLCVHINVANSFSRIPAEDLVFMDIPYMYTPGFVEPTLAFGRGGTSLFAQYEVLIKELLSRPNAVAFIAAGGVASWVAQFSDKTLLAWYLQEPSEQVADYQRGDMIRLPSDPTQRYTCDQVSEGETSQLLGEIKMDHLSTDLSLWPLQQLLEEESRHFHRAHTALSILILKNLAKDIGARKFMWCTRSQWIRYFRGGNKGKHALSVSPTQHDFEEGERLMSKYYPLSWQNVPVRSIVFPESFKAFVPGE